MQKYSMLIAADLLTTFLLCLFSTVAACGVSGIGGSSNDIAIYVIAIGSIIGVIQTLVKQR